jgi:RNA polymerase sigma factor (sigma-70 family)
MSTTGVEAFIHRLARGMAAEGLAGLSDRQLVERLLVSADEAVFEALVRRHGAMVYRVCWRTLQQAEDTEDAFQATFLLLAQKLKNLRKQASLASWLHGVAHRASLDARKRAARRRRHEARASGPALAPPDEANWGEVRAILDTELAALPEQQRLPLILCYLEARTQDEAARQLGWSKSTLVRRLGAARAALGRRLARKGFVWSAAGAAVLLTDAAAPAAPTLKTVWLTVETAVGALTGRRAAGAISANVLVLTEGVLNTMFLTKLQLAAGVLVLAIVAAALWFVGLPGLAAQQEPPQRTAKSESAKVAPDVPAVATPKPLQEGPNRLLIGRFDRLSLMDAAGMNEKNLLAARPYIDGVRLSPDGKRVAFIASDPTANEPTVLLYVAGVDDKDGQSLGVSPRAFAWSPDGTEIAYTEFTSDKKLTATHGIINVKTGVKSELKLPDDHYITDWSRDGKHFVTTHIWPHAGVFLVNRDGTVHKALTEKRLPAGSYGLFGRLSPDSKQLLFLIVTPKEKDRQAGPELAVLDIATGKVTPVADIPINGEVRSYCWSPDGKRIAYAWSEVVKGEAEELANQEVESRVVVCEPSGKNAQVIVTEKGRLVTIPGMDWK